MTKYIPVLSMVLIMLGLLLFLFVDANIGIYVFSSGAIVLAFLRVIALVRSQNRREISRLPQINILSVAALCGAAYLMYDGSNSWSVMLLVSAVLEIYVSYRQK